MSWDTLICLALVLLAIIAAGLWWRRRPHSVRPTVGFGAAIVVLGAATAMLADHAAPLTGWERWVVIGLDGAGAVVVGGAVTLAVLSLADREAGIPQPTVHLQALRGGAWIGVLERLGIFAALVSGYPEGVALILAIKGLARYPELRAGQQSGVAERFIIGTFTSIAVAAGYAGLTHLLLT